MASNFSANQYEKEFTAKRLGNWEVPHWYPEHPIRRTETTKIIADDKGHLLPNVQRPKSSAWGRYLSTWQLPKRITKDQAFEINAPPIGGSRWALPGTKTVNFGNEVMEEFQEPTRIKEEIKKEEEIEKLPEDMIKTETPKRDFSGKAKLNNPIAISQQKREIRHETLERDKDDH